MVSEFMKEQSNLCGKIGLAQEFSGSNGSQSVSTCTVSVAYYHSVDDADRWTVLKHDPNGRV